jgi:DNA/RNA-binding domain of Phe-tRNA-synthetase-like protein
MHIDISGIISDFPRFRVAAVVASGIEVASERSAELADLIGGREAACRERWGKTDLAEIPGIAAWRQAYRAFGIKRTSYRSSVERLVKNVLAGRALPEINNFVDAYNAVSLAHVMPLGADDFDLIAGDIAFRYSRLGDEFLDMASGGEGIEGVEVDPPKEGEVVYADAEKILCRRWNWRQDIRSLVTPLTRRAVITVQSIGSGDLEAAVADLVEAIKHFAGGTSAVTIVDYTRPLASLEEPVAT